MIANDVLLGEYEKRLYCPECGRRLEFDEFYTDGCPVLQHDETADVLRCHNVKCPRFMVTVNWWWLL